MPNKKELIETKVGYPKSCKIIVFIAWSFWMLFISWAYFDGAFMDFRNIILYMIGVMIGLWFVLHFLRPTVYIYEKEVRWQSIIFPFAYRKISLNNIKKVRLVTKNYYDVDRGPIDVMIFYGEKYRLFSVGMKEINAQKLYQAVASNYGTRIQDQRKKTYKNRSTRR